MGECPPPPPPSPNPPRRNRSVTRITSTFTIEQEEPGPQEGTSHGSSRGSSPSYPGTCSPHCSSFGTSWGSSRVSTPSYPGTCSAHGSSSSQDRSGFEMASPDFLLQSPRRRPVTPMRSAGRSAETPYYTPRECPATPGRTPRRYPSTQGRSRGTCPAGPLTFADPNLSADSYHTAHSQTHYSPNRTYTMSSSGQCPRSPNRSGGTYNIDANFNTTYTIPNLNDTYTVDVRNKLDTTYTVPNLNETYTVPNLNDTYTVDDRNRGGTTYTVPNLNETYTVPNLNDTYTVDDRNRCGTTYTVPNLNETYTVPNLNDTYTVDDSFGSTHCDQESHWPAGSQGSPNSGRQRRGPVATSSPVSGFRAGGPMAASSPNQQNTPGSFDLRWDEYAQMQRNFNLTDASDIEEFTDNFYQDITTSSQIGSPPPGWSCDGNIDEFQFSHIVSPSRSDRSRHEDDLVARDREEMFQRRDERSRQPPGRPEVYDPWAPQWNTSNYSTASSGTSSSGCEPIAPHCPTKSKRTR